MRTLAPFAALAVLLLATAAPSRATVYRWKDAAGTPHFSDRPEDVPPEYREQLPTEVHRDGPAAGLAARLEARMGAMARSGSAARPTPPPQPTRRGSAPPDLSKLALLKHLGVGGVLALGVGLIGFSFLFYAFVIQLACRICGEDSPAYSRALGVVGVQFVAGVGLGIIEVAILGFASAGGGLPSLVRGVNSILGFAVNVSVLRAMLGQTLGKAVAVQIVSILISAIIAIALGMALLAGLGGMAALHASG